MKTITLPDGREISYEIVRKNIRSIIFRIKQDGVVYVSASPRVTEGYIEELLSKRGAHLLESAERLRRREERSEIGADNVNWLGGSYPVRVYSSFRECAAIEQSECRVFTMRTDDREHIAELIRRMVAERFAALCGELDREVRDGLAAGGLTPPPTRITIKDMSSRWGSCSYNRGHISINIRLAAYPRETVLSVLWHEYAHYWHHDHSERFYAFLERFFPEYRRWNGLLKG